MRWYFILLGLMLQLAVSCNQPVPPGPTDTPGSGTISISVDESFRPVMEEQIRVFEGANPGAKINAVYKAEAECLKDLFRDSATRMVIVTRGLTKKEAGYFDDSLHYVPRSERIATDAIAVVINANSPDSVYTLLQLQQMLSGEVNNGKKIVFDGLSATSTVRFAMDSILKGKKFDTMNVQAAKNSSEVLDYVANNNNAIGLVGSSWIANPEDTAQLRMLKKLKFAFLNCAVCPDSAYVRPTQAGIMTHRYPLVRGLYYVLKENFSGLGSGFASFLQYEKGQLVFRRGYLWPAQISFNVRNVIVNEKLKED